MHGSRPEKSSPIRPRWEKAATFLLAICLLALTAAPAFAYTIYLKDGSRLIAKEAYEIRGDQAIITLQNGARTSIAATEIDAERTREANLGGYGSALVLDDGKLTEMPAEEEPADEGSLSDLIGERRSAVASRPPARRPVPEAESAEAEGAGVDFRELPRRPFSDLDMAAEVQRIFRAQGVEQVLISQGTRPERLLIDLTTNSEASVFRALEVAASALVHARDLYPSNSAIFELLLSTAEREPAGQFVLTRSLAQILVDGDLDPSTFYIQNVQF